MTNGDYLKTLTQFSTIQRCLGKLEGMGYAFDMFSRISYLSVLQELSNAIEELKPQVKEDEE